MESVGFDGCSMRGGALALVAAFGFAAAASADEVSGASVDVPASGSVTERILDILVRSGTITDAQYQELRAQAEQEEREAAETAAAAEAGSANVAAGPEDWSLKWDNGFKVERSDGAYKLKFGGRAMLDTAIISQDRELENAIGGEGNGVELRRARIFMEGTLHERLFFRTAYDFAGGDVVFKDVFMGLNKLGPVGSVQVGQFKETFMLEEMTSSKYITFMERGLSNVFFPGRAVGAMAQNAVLDDRMTWQVGVYRAADDQGFSFGDNSDWDVTARVTGAPLYADGGEKLVHLGFSYSHEFRGADFEQRYRQRPEAHLAQRYVDTGSFDANDVDLFDLAAAAVFGPLSIQSEVTASRTTRNGGLKEVRLWGAYAYASWFLTGEHRPYDLGKGRFKRLEPKNRFDPGRRDWGAWEVAARFSYLDLNDREIEGGKMWDVTAGVNWYLYSNARIMLNYIHSQLMNRAISGDPDLDGRANIVEMRFQVDF